MEDESEIRLEQLISRSVAGEREALDLLIVHCWTIQLLQAVSIWAEHKYKQNRDDVRQFVTVVLLTRITTLENLKHRLLRKCVRSFCFTTARNHCLSIIEHEKVVTSHVETQKCEQLQVQRRSRRGSVPVQCSTAPTPEEIFLKKERISRVKAAVQKVSAKYPRHEKILALWLEGNEVKEIAKAMDRSVKTIYPPLRKIQKALFKELEDPLNHQIR